MMKSTAGVYHSAAGCPDGAKKIRSYLCQTTASSGVIISDGGQATTQVYWRETVSERNLSEEKNTCLTSLFVKNYVPEFHILLF